MTNLFLLLALLLLPGNPEAFVPRISTNTVVVDERQEVEAIGAAFEKLLGSSSHDLGWFVELYAPSAIERIGSDRIELMLGMFQHDMAGAKLRAVRATGEHEWNVLLYSAASNVGAIFELSVEPEAPHRILGIGARLVDGDPVVDGIVDGMTAEDMARVIDGYVTGLAERDEFSGAVLLAKDGEPVFEKAWGLASRSFDVPNNVETRFNLGSMNKMFTALAIAQLQAAGKLDFDDKLIQHLPDYPNRAVAEQVTLHQLLTHTSGMGSFFDSMLEVNWTELRTPADHLRLFVDEPLAFEPGTRFSYSNSGFLVLGLVIEAVSGQSYYDYVRENIYAKAGMTSSDSWAMDEPVKNLAIGYTRSSLEGDGHSQEGPLRNNLYLHRARGGPAGGGFSTVGDLLRFANALLDGRLLSPEATANLLEGKVDTGWGPAMKYAYGFMEDRREGHASFGHSGGAPGINSVLAVYPADGYTVVVLANCDQAASLVSERIEEMIVRSSK